MKTNYRIFSLPTFIIICFLLISAQGKGQFIGTAPTLNGVIAASEYGSTANGTNQILNGGVTTYMTWDNTNLYIAVSGASVNDATIIYIDKDNMVPVNGGGVAQGVTVGQLLDNTNFSNLPYRADLVLYARNGLFQYYTNNLGSWSLPSSLNMAYNDNGLATTSGVKEFSIAWSVIGGRPASFNFFGYNTSSTGSVYNTFPSANGTGNIGLSARFERYYTVSSTLDGSSTLPFSRDCFVFNNAGNEFGFGAISVYNFTMNSGGLSIFRSATGGDWNIAGSFVNNAGNIDFGNSGSFGNTNVGSLQVIGGFINLNQTNMPITVAGNISISGGTLTLSGTAGGDLLLGGNLNKTGGTFNCNGRKVNFNGITSQSFTSTVTETIDILTETNTSVGGVTFLSSCNVGKAAVNSFNISPSASLFVNAGSFTIANKALGTVDGKFINKGGIIFVPFTAPNTATINVTSTGSFIHNMDGGTIPILAWGVGSTCSVTGWISSASLLGGLNQSFYNFIWNSPSQTSNISLASSLSKVIDVLTITSTGSGSVALADNTALNISIGNYSQSGGKFYLAKGTSLPIVTINGDFNLSGGNMDFNILNSATGSVVNLAGNFTYSGGTITHSGASGNGSFVFNGSVIQNITSAAVISKTDFQINNGASVLLNSNVNLSGGVLKLQTGGTLTCSIYTVSGGNFVQQTGSTLKTASLDASGALTTSLASGSIQTTSRTYHPGASFEFNGSSIQSTGDFASLLTPANTVANLKINNTAAISTSGVTLSSPITVTGILDLTVGKISTTGTNILSLGNACSISGGSSSSYIDGPLLVNYLANLSGATSFQYPIGSGSTYLPLGLLNVKTGASAPSITISAFNTGAGGTYNTSLSALSGTEYWSTVVSSGTFTSASIQLGRSVVLGAYNAIGSSTTKTGVYTFIGNTVVSTTDLSSSTQNSLTYYCLGTLQPAPTISAIQPQGPITANLNSGYAGQTIKIQGTNFTLSNMTVTINGVTPSFTLVSPTLITAVVPAGIISGPLVVKNILTGASVAKAFTYNGVVSKADGDWAQPSTWLHGALPLSNDIITINNNVIISTELAIFPNVIIITNSNSLNFIPPGSSFSSISVLQKIINQGTITMANNTYIQMTNHSTFDNSDPSAIFAAGGNSYIIFNNDGSLVGPVNLNNLEIGGVVNFVNNPTINGNLQIDNAGVVTGTAPNYNSTSTLFYEGNTTFSPGLEWSSNTAQPGMPFNVQVGSGQYTTVDISKGTAPNLITGKLNIFNGNLTLGNSSIPLTVNDNILIGNSSAITLSSVSGGDLIAKGNLTNLGSFNSNNRNITFDNKLVDQTVDAESILSLGSLNVDKGSKKVTFLTPTSANRIVNIYNSLNVISGTLDLNNLNFVLKSNAAFTAGITNILGTLLNASNITAERFIPAHRAWVLLGTPVNSNQTIKATWQEGQSNLTMTNSNTKPGYGVHITGPSTANGFDLNPAKKYSIKAYNSSTDSWDGVLNTNVLKLTSQPGYMLFVRGSRATNLALGTYATADNTTLEANGSLRQGAQTTNIGLGVSKFVLVNNPYPCTIDFHTITKPAALGDKFSVWDPYLTGNYGVGGYVTFTWDGVSSYASSIAGFTPGLGRYIQSGQAFMVQGTANPADNLVINESDKVGTSTSNIFSRLGSTSSPEQLRINLNIKNSDASYTLVDGALAIYNDQFDNGHDAVDAAKIGNFRENIYFFRGPDSLAIEARKIIKDSDTLFFNVAAFNNNYQLSIECQNLDHPGLLGFLNDNFLKTKTAINLSDTTNYDFAVTADPASSSVDRFTITFKKEETLPVTFVEINAEKKNDNISVNWIVNNQTNIKNYSVQKSENGNDFYSIGEITAKGSSTGTINYTFDDQYPNDVNFYKIVSHGFNGEAAKSKVIKIDFKVPNTFYSITPNPIENGIVNLHIKGVIKGTYQVKLLNNNGQTITTKTVYKENAPEGLITLDKRLTHGNYLLEVLDPNKQVTTLKVIY